MKVRPAGFTLIEVVIAMVIVAVLTAIAIPNYTAYIQRSNRSDARSLLAESALWMERFRTENGTYVGAVLPASLSRSPALPAAARYNITAGALTVTTYTLTATAVGTMAADVCGNLMLNNLGQRTWSGGAGTMDVCWNR